MLDVLILREFVHLVGGVDVAVTDINDQSKFELDVAGWKAGDKEANLKTDL